MNYLLIAILATGLSTAAQAQGQPAAASKGTDGVNSGQVTPPRVTCSKSNRPTDITSMEPDYEMKLADMAPASSCTEASMGKAVAMNPAKLLAQEPTAAGLPRPGLTRAEVIAEMFRARDAGEMNLKD